MMNLEKINDYIDRLGLSKAYVSQFFINENGKPATRQYVGQILNGTNVMGEEAYKKLIIAINKAQMEKKKETYSKAMDKIEILDSNKLENL